jgi:hypothetical protein
MERNFEAGETRRLAAKAAANAAAKAASNERARVIAASMLRRSERAGTRSRSRPPIRENTKLRNPLTQTQEQNPRGMAAGWTKTRNEFHRMSSKNRGRYLRVLKKQGYSDDIIYNAYEVFP